MRTIRNRAVTLAATALVASLALTACGSGESSGAAKDTAETAASSGAGTSAGHKSSGADAPTQGSTGSGDTDTSGGADNKQPAPADQISTNGSKGGKGGSDSGKAGDSGEAGKGSAGSKYTTCTGANTKVKISQVSRPINHLLLTVVNTGSKNCDAYYAPFLRFDEAQAAAQIIEDSQPQAVVTLAPGEAAYASISLNGDGNPRIPAKKLTVSFPGRDNQGSVGPASAPITLPAGTRIADDTSVTHWQSNMADALTW